MRSITCQLNIPRSSVHLLKKRKEIIKCNTILFLTTFQTKLLDRLRVSYDSMNLSRYSAYN